MEEYILTHGTQESYQASGPSSLCSEVLAGGAALFSALLAQPTAGRLDSSLRRPACRLSPALTPRALQAFPTPTAPDPSPPKPNLKIPFFHSLSFQDGDATLATNTLAPRAYLVLSSQAGITTPQPTLVVVVLQISPSAIWEQVMQADLAPSSPLLQPLCYHREPCPPSMTNMTKENKPHPRAGTKAAQDSFLSSSLTRTLRPSCHAAPSPYLHDKPGGGCMVRAEPSPAQWGGGAMPAWKREGRADGAQRLELFLCPVVCKQLLQ